MKQTLQVSIWSFRDIRLVLPARALSYAGDSVALVALMLRVSETGGPGAVTALLLAFAVPTVAMIPFAGRIVDGYDSRAVLVCASLLQVVAGLGLAFSHGLAETLALVCLLQVGQAVAGPAWAALIPRIVGEQLVGRATGTSQALVGVATLAGSAAGGVLVSWSGERGALLVDTATFGVVALVALAVRTRRRPVADAVREQGALTAGLRSLLGDPLLRILVVCLWVFVVVGEAVNVVEVFLVTDELGLDAAGYGWVMAAQGGGAILGAWGTGRLTSATGRSRAMLAGMAAIGAACVLMGVAGGAFALFVGAVVVGAGGGLLNAASSTLIVTRTAEEVRGRAIAALGGTVRACSLVALPLGGLLAAVLGTRTTFVVCGIACGVAAALAAVLVVRTNDSVPEVVSH
ncbi:MFS transporter [Kribbella sp. NPDC051770]|uniref:MFS transporter n=1 Tax=Kribbella sp. NPDC051770 TaxID=3155413 RepID=UPI003431DB4D